MTAVEVEDITKIYKLYDKPLDRLKEMLTHRTYHKNFVALDGITFTIEKGETLGIIGDNGAGKSTLLKILSRTLSPTRGRFEVKGVVSSILELGSGFHPEFTGIENIYLYGSLLGIDSNLMKKNVDEIIEFSELGAFIHYPLKTYSSGMHVRLAFSVATAVNPDIMIIDEALSVGDQYFQRKCLDKMADFKKKEKTIVFCSHDLYQIKTFCEKTLWLNKGNVAMLGDSGEVVNSYAAFEQMKSDTYKTEERMLREGHVEQSSFISIRDLIIRQEDPRSLIITCSVKSLEPFYGHLGWAILRKDQFQISFMTTQMQGREPTLFDGLRKASIRITDLNIVNGTYFIYVGIFDRQAYKPIAIESIECEVNTGIEILNSLCHFNSTFSIEQLPYVKS